MADERPNLFSRIVDGAAAGAAATLSFFRSGRDPLIDADQAAALAAVDKRRWSAQLLKQLEWRRFEELCVAYFQARGSAQDAPFALRCKPWDAHRVGIKAVRELQGSMAAEGMAEGVLLTAGRFTQEAANHARQHNIQLIDGAGLLAAIAALAPETALGLLRLATQGDFLTPTCPNCSVKMISRQSTRHGRKFWGCRNYPRCKQIFSGAAHASA